ncbi:restriction endonuclease [Aestuariivirga sp.]|uniref:restriction endonuclease n=1 Tax=Aestuariivirga sp. TaxID=2650926 RepID=UPI0025C101AF|nr:restriction endonuclease [Aestuariivirga sp.]MCA3556319.1 restriction endonuclease [Aestuariivirga sp.]
MFVLSDFQQLMQPASDELELPEAPSAFIGGITEEGCAALTALVNASNAVLHRELIAHIHTQTPEFFERLVIDVLLAMGYGSDRSGMARCLGRSGDGGIDGIIPLDELGFDTICIQAKRLKPGVAVPIADVRDFAGSLEARRAGKGVFVTTTHFSSGAAEFCAQLVRRVVLIDGNRLAELMMRHGLGIRVQHRFEIRALDLAYFTRVVTREPGENDGENPAAAGSSRGPVSL